MQRDYIITNSDTFRAEHIPSEIQSVEIVDSLTVWIIVVAGARVVVAVVIVVAIGVVVVVAVKVVV